MKIENFPAEWDFFLSEIGVKENIKLPWANKAQDDYYDEQQYLQKLTKSERVKLYDLPITFAKVWTSISFICWEKSPFHENIGNEFSLLI